MRRMNASAALRRLNSLAPSAPMRTAFTRPAADVSRLAPVLEQLGFVDLHTWSTRSLESLAPLLTEQFVVEREQYSAAGEEAIRRYLGEVLFDYAVYRQLMMTPNVADEAVACLMNHYSLRLLGEEIGLVDVANPQFSGKRTGGRKEEDLRPEDVLGFLSDDRQRLSERDLRQTAFALLPREGGASSVPRKLCHLIGAIQVEFGWEAAAKAIDALYRLRDEPNVPRAIAGLVSRAVERYPAATVAVAIIRAQRLTPRFECSSVGDLSSSASSPPHGHEAGDGSEGASTAEAAAYEDHGGDDGDGEDGDDEDYVSDADAEALAALGVDEDEIAALSNETHAGDMTEQQKLARDPAVKKALDSLAGAPEGLSGVQRQERWLDRATDEAALINSEQVGDNGDQAERQSPPDAALMGGFIDPEQEQGRASRSSVVPGGFFADAVGVPQPKQGGWVARRKPRQSLATDPAGVEGNSSELKKGIPFETGGLPTFDAIRMVAKPHVRQFKVSLYLDPEGVGATEIESDSSGAVPEAGSAIATRYTTAREDVLVGYLRGVVGDVELMASRGGN